MLAGSDVAGGLADRLFVPQERCGWEFVPPASTSLDLGSEPVLVEPEQPDVSELEQLRQKGKRKLVKRALISAVVWFMVLFSQNGTLVFWVLVAGVVWSWGWPVLWPGYKIKAARRKWRAARDQAQARHRAECAERESRHQAHERVQLEQAATLPLWYPVPLESRPSRLDVFGGTGDGWASLVTTLGCGLLETGARVLVLDVSEQQVGEALAAYAAPRGTPVTQLDLPQELSSLDVLGDLSAEAVAEVIAEAVSSMRPAGEGSDLRALDAEVVEVVAKRLDGQVSFDRLAAGIKVLRRVYDPYDGEGPLSATEITRLNGCVDLVGQTERVQQEMQFLTGQLELLAQQQPLPADPSPVWPNTGLTVLSTDGTHARRKDFTDRVIFHRLVHDLRSRRTGRDGDVLVVAGADHLGRESLEALVRQARICRVRLVLLLEHLRGDLESILGGGDSAAVLMRMGNTAEAEAAAKFIGRDHTFVLSQLTEQTGQTLTEGTAYSTGEQESTAHTRGRALTLGTQIQRGSAMNKQDAKELFSSPSQRSTSSGSSRSISYNSSITQTRAQTWQDTVNRSQATTTNEGATYARTYDFTIEPTTLQSLAATAFFLVETGPSGRRVVCGDCNPGIAMLDRVSPAPLALTQ